MSEQENMVRAWSMTLMPVLNGFALAIEAMVRAGEERKIVEVSIEVMRLMMNSCPPENRQLLSKQLNLLSRLANESRAAHLKLAELGIALEDTPKGTVWKHQR